MMMFLLLIVSRGDWKHAFWSLCILRDRLVCAVAFVSSHWHWDVCVLQDIDCCIGSFDLVVVLLVIMESSVLATPGG